MHAHSSYEHTHASPTTTPARSIFLQIRGQRGLYAANHHLLPWVPAHVSTHVTCRERKWKLLEEVLQGRNIPGDRRNSRLDSRSPATGNSCKAPNLGMTRQTPDYIAGVRLPSRQFPPGLKVGGDLPYSRLDSRDPTT